ncbi:MAG: Inner membrane protein YrbG [candidate division TA06 bacterium ADurb.Bin417]|uniref:Inner membrane protein YrbG n=1 Tax=candidate division TA06 bacterium ADurb.Bin417 TaxID=1852828 RepID=A0A1V5MIN5_UNCT6|nr:MAG: Inner membrane protein YrbG [candidate division TA06 bacterium ADurb.Bin417]
MATWLAWFLLAVSFGIIFLGSEWFVNSSVRIAEGLRVPKVLVGATIVSLATTAPELFVSALAAFLGKVGLAAGNAVGSPISNIGFIFGLCVLFTFVPVDQKVIRKQGLMMIGTALMAFAVSFHGMLDRPVAVFFLVLTGLYLWYSVHKARQESRKAPLPEEAIDFRPGRKILLFLLGAALVIGGSRLLIFAGTELARSFGISETVIGLTLVAVGTSLPEFFTSVAALTKGHLELSAGNIIGANILDVVWVLGVAGAIRPLPIDSQTSCLALPVLVILSALFVIFGITHRGFKRWEGAVLLLVYALYCLALFRACPV